MSRWKKTEKASTWMVPEKRWCRYGMGADAGAECVDDWSW